MQTDSANPTLPTWAFAAFTTDPNLDRVIRIAIVERQLLGAFGALHVPDKEGRERYFAKDLDAKLQRRWLAQRIVEEQDWRENFAAILGLPHGQMLPSLREAAEAQMREFAETGRVTVTGLEVA